MKSVFILLVIGISILAVVACGGSSSSEPTNAPTETVTPTATPMPTETPTPTTAPTAAASLGASVASCLEASIGADGAEAALSNLVTPTPEQQSALNDCLLSASLGDGQSTGTSENTVLACLTRQLGEAVAMVVQSGLIPPTAEEAAILGACVLSASATTATEDEDPVVACLEEDLGADLARAVASGGIPLTSEQESLLGNCVLSTSLSSSSASSAYSESIVACLESALGAESAAIAASGSGDLSSDQQVALGACLLGSSTSTTTTSTSSTVSAGVLACLTAELGADVAQVVASAVLPLSTSEEQILGNCVVMDALGLTP